MNYNYSITELSKIAADIIEKSEHKTIVFYGEMGVGKTTLIKELCKLLGTNDLVNSPTFSIVNEYKTNENQTIYHFDFYRLSGEQEAYDIGFEDYLYSNNWCFIEWPSMIQNLLPLKKSIIHLTALDNGLRNIQLK